MTDRIDIHDPITEICERLGLIPQLVGELILDLTIKPSTITATTYVTGGASGSKQINTETGNPITQTTTFPVTT